MVKSNTTIYNRWKHMKERCNNPNRKDYKYYGGKGIRVVCEWDFCFDSFEEWFCNAYKRYIKDNDYIDQSELAVDRIDSDGMYSPFNCRLITRSENISIASRKHWAKYREAKDSNVDIHKSEGKKR